MKIQNSQPFLTWTKYSECSQDFKKSDYCVVVPFFHTLLLNGQMSFTSNTQIPLLVSQHFLTNICHHCFPSLFTQSFSRKGNYSFLFSLVFMKKEIMFLFLSILFYCKSIYDKYARKTCILLRGQQIPKDRQVFIKDDIAYRS